MAQITEYSMELQELIRRIDEAVEMEDHAERCTRVKQALSDVVSDGNSFLPESYLKPASEKYARRLLHKDPGGRYSIVVMVWGPNQGTPLHDHAAKWCVECVYKGRIRVTSFDIEGDPEQEVVQFKKESEITAGIAEAGALIPPFEYHMIENVDDTPSATIHVYAGEMDWCNLFFPVAKGYRRERRELTYTD